MIMKKSVFEEFPATGKYCYDLLSSGSHLGVGKATGILDRLMKGNGEMKMGRERGAVPETEGRTSSLMTK
jgi:hypothetical protein